MARRRIATLALIALALAAPGISRADEARPALDGLRDPWTAAQDLGKEPARAAFARTVASKKATPAEVLDARRALLAAPRSEGGSGLFSVADLPRPATTDTHGGPGVGLVAYPVPSGDLDGDGADDLLTVEIDWLAFDPITGALDPPTLRARRGTDGSAMWSRTIPFSTLIGTMNLDGAAANEVVLMEETDVGAIALVAGAILLQQDVSVLQGTDGTTLWTQRFTGTIFLAFPLFAGVIGLVNVVTALTPAGDANGDGAPDLFVETIDAGVVLAFALVAFAVAEPVRSIGHTHAGSTGAEFGAVSALGVLAEECHLFSCTLVGGFPQVLAAGGDVSGDGEADLFTLTALPTDSNIRGVSADGTVHWTAPVPLNLSFAVSVPLEDAAPDLILDRFDYSAFLLNLDAYDGADGSALWSRVLGSFSGWIAVGDAGGDGGSEVLTAEAVAEDEIDFALVGGATGANVWTLAAVAPAKPGYFGVMLACLCPTDLDADGVDDVFIAPLMLDQNFNRVNLQASGVSGATGSLLWTTPPLASFDLLPIPADGDVNGNGTEDVVGLDVTETASDVLVDFLFRDGGSYADAGAATISLGTAPEFWYLTALFGANLNGGAADEMVTGAELFGFDYDYGDAYGFAPGGVLWQVPA